VAAVDELIVTHDDGGAVDTRTIVVALQQNAVGGITGRDQVVEVENIPVEGYILGDRRTIRPAPETEAVGGLPHLGVNHLDDIAADRTAHDTHRKGRPQQIVAPVVQDLQIAALRDGEGAGARAGYAVDGAVQFVALDHSATQGAASKGQCSARNVETIPGHGEPIPGTAAAVQAVVPLVLEQVEFDHHRQVAAGAEVQHALGRGGGFVGKDAVA